MRLWNARLTSYAALICLPVLMAVGVGTWYAYREITSQVASERLRVTRTLRAAAEELKDASRTNGLAGVAFEPPVRRKGWRTIGRIDDCPWGVGVTNGTSVVWVHRKNVRRARFVPAPPVRKPDFSRAWLLAAGVFFIDLVLAGLAFLSVTCFVRYMRERDDFLAATAHDLTTPLVGLRMMIGRDDDEARNLNERMIRLVTNIKDFLNLGGRRPAPKAETFDLVAAYREAYALFAADYRDLFDGEDVEVSGLSSAPVRADETMTVQILWNLLGNDLKYAAPHGRVRVRFLREGDRVLVEFADEGTGMTPWQMRRAFDRYYRAKTVKVSGKGGFGIGLCTAKEFARAMGGDLTVRENTPHGCIFTLSLPASRLNGIQKALRQSRMVRPVSRLNILLKNGSDSYPQRPAIGPMD